MFISKKESQIKKKHNNNSSNQKWYQAFLKKRTFLLLLFPLSLIILQIVKNNQWIAEYIFARGIYKGLSKVLGMITGILPFSLMEFEIILIPIIIVVFLVIFLIRLFLIIKKRERKLGSYIATNLLNIACIGSVILFSYVILAGTNYYRYPFSFHSDLEVRDSSVDELFKLSLSLSNKAASLRESIHMQEEMEDENNIIVLDDWKKVVKEANEAYDELSVTYPLLKGYKGAPKPVLFSDFMSKMEITGIFWPFTMEANINVSVPNYSIPATIGHELAHVRGFMREDEANFIAYLVCRESDDIRFQYSGVMLALSYSMNQLYKQDLALYKIVQGNYTEEMMADLRDEYYYWNAIEDPVISTISNKINDTYLKANNQTDGIKSYGRMVDLLLAEYRKENGID